MSKRKKLEPTAGQVITVGKGGVPRLLIKSQTTHGDLDAVDFAGEMQFQGLLKRGVLYDKTYVFAAHSLEAYFKKQSETPK
jgi:hypothetical protein